MKLGIEPTTLVYKASGLSTTPQRLLWTANGANKRLVLHVLLQCGSLSITTPVSLLANELDVQSVMHRQVSLAAVNQICVIHEAMNRCKTLNSIKHCTENVNIYSILDMFMISTDN